MKISQKKYSQISETLKDFKCLIPRYIEVRGNPDLFKSFCSRNRNPLWDITNISFFKTGLVSESAKKSQNVCDDHFIQRRFSMMFIFDELIKNPNMSVDEFIKVILRYSSTIVITKDEHMLVTSRTKNTDEFNFKVYDELGIKVIGIEKYFI